MFNESVTSQEFDIPNDQSRPVSTSYVYSHKDNKMETNSTSNQKLEKSKPKKKSGFKVFISFILKNFGILFVVIFYTGGGAFLFSILEQHNEIQNCQSGEGEWNKIRIDYRSQFFNYIYFNTTPNPWLPVDNATKEAGLYVEKDGPATYDPLLTEWMVDFREKILKIDSDYGYSGQDCEKQSSWTYFSALLFTITIMTTLGYGHVSPATPEGQIVCICYSLLGIPLFVISTVKISNLLGDLLVFLTTNILCFCCHKSKKDNKDDQKEQSPDDWNESENNDIIKVVDDMELEDQYEEDDRFVPLIIVLIVFAGYLVLGAYLFTLIESDWNLLQSSYYAFVSLSTIGFGDYVPGIGKVLSGNEAEGGRNLLIASIYIYVGLAILGMCFQLIQDQISEKFGAIAEKLSCFKKKEDEPQEQLPTSPQPEINKEISDVENSKIEIREATIISVKPKDESAC
ncbi:T family of potassium channels 18-like [Brachionus plicatilis]|uniref:T family of potassium channels 18-like n=1 Tax=Brachionus plicatilis TaxID=10195 RepID=A0A3M7Q810_BRAPC|nr:T family of potassium channels 18-like [Brachionus plicatilis]